MNTRTKLLLQVRYAQCVLESTPSPSPHGKEVLEEFKKKQRKGINLLLEILGDPDDEEELDEIDVKLIKTINDQLVKEMRAFLKNIDTLYYPPP